jgi:hypothetical protein
LVERDYKNVNTDVTLLQRLGLVTPEAKSGKGRAQVPTVPYDEIQVNIDLQQPHPAHAPQFSIEAGLGESHERRRYGELRIIAFWCR